MNKGIAEQARVEEDWRKRCYELWRLLDNIDTLDDACREDDARFRELTRIQQRKRFDTVGEAEIDTLYADYFSPREAAKPC